jgi:hypothetical protein
LSQFPQKLTLSLQYIIPLFPLSHFEIESPPIRVYVMTTRSQNLIFKPLKFTDGRIKYPLPQALTASIALHEEDLTCFSQASRVAHSNEYRV